MSTSTIGKQAANYAEVIVGQIVSNFETLSATVKHCSELQDAKSEYDKASLSNGTLKNIDVLQKRVEIIEMHLGDVVCDGYSSIEPLAVGLFGEWGSGKTHQLKLIKKALLSLENKEDMPISIPVFLI